jgi:hypothetical protein
MTWYLWLMSGIVGGMVLSFGLIIASTYVIMHSPALQHRFMSRTMKHMMKGSVPQSKPRGETSIGRTG